MNGSDDRNQSVERLLRQSFKAPQHGTMDSCLDAETIAAWMDGGLSGAALEIAQAHVADCARCRAVVGEVVRAEAAVLPATVPTRRRWPAWLVPLTAAAAAVVIWVAVPGNPGGPGPATTNQQEQVVDANAPERMSPAVSPDDSGRAPAAEQEQQSQSTRDLAGSAPSPVPELRREAARFEADDPKQQAEAAKEVAPADERAAAAAPSPGPPAAAPSTREAVQGRPANAFAAASVGIEILSPDPAIRWRIAGTAVQRSTDAGTRWESLPLGTTAELVAGAAPSTTVCWLVGRGGLVLLSTDGQVFSRVMFPEMTDLSAVRATDARTATVSTADGRTFDTSDGGVTWVPR